MGRRVRAVMTPEVVTVGERASFKEMAATMAEHRVSALPVLDEEGRVAGIVSQADLLLKEEFPEGRAGACSRAAASVWSGPRRPALPRPS